MKVPKDPDLYLTVFVAIGVGIVMVFWLLTPVYTPHHEEGEEPEAHAAAKVKPAQALAQVDATLAAAEKTLAEMKAKDGGKVEKAVDSKKDLTKAVPVVESSKPAEVVPASSHDDHAGHDMASQDHESEESSHDHGGGGDHGH